MEIKRVARSEFRVAGELVWRIENVVPQPQATDTISQTRSRQDLLVTEAIRRVVSEYGEVLKKLSNE